MIWFFERKGQFVRCEARQAPDGMYELIVIDADGSERLERFENSADLQKRQVAVEQQFVSEGWTGPHGREM